VPINSFTSSSSIIHLAFKQQIVSQFFDDYFIEKVNTELGVTITKENIITYWHNIEDNQNVLMLRGFLLQ
jgi:hypothetical protein